MRTVPARDPASPRLDGAPPAGMHRIVIVGGGAGGLELATTLGDKLGKRGRAHVTLVDKTRSHIWKPKLHEIAAGSMDIGVHEVDFLAQSHWHHFPLPNRRDDRARPRTPRSASGGFRR